ncbi:hypothetical protein N7539_003858 [Penicillium diatomitis]|uniref:Zn(2)-C6 fungal-type domain-containing protein n=1 Tax=Penicillium diatomitis TaxID=2819901 RepID=A0A9X0BY34_9EURO|nr:uncharacterized protein N7539_003858 [Penicillium diatomitis]KAJ5488968.1 hypothetical protein N7539_003858 [Penicillium diatomitis]
MVDAVPTEGGPALTASRPVRKKFAQPPVKLACLPCRASRTRCGGQDPCSNCVAKGRKCSYLPSKRGGPRKKKQKSSCSPEREASQGETQYMVDSSTDFGDSPGLFNQIDVLSLPGAGLRHLDYPHVGSLFQGFYVGEDSSSPLQMESMPSTISTRSCLVRTYGTESDILNAYYDFIHLYFPILPPRPSRQFEDRPLHCPVSSEPTSEPVMMYKPRSPLSLAISAVLALIPHPEDPEPSASVSVLVRRSYAHSFAQLANSMIEAECDLELSSTYPGQALSSMRPSVNRDRLHPSTPEDIETVLALLILSVYEYTQRGNLLKMRYRAGQALALALEKNLHSCNDNDHMSEARRRAWWMTYYCVLQGSIVSTTPPTIVINDPQFTTPYPNFDSDAEGWSILIQSQQVLVSATQYISDLNKSLATQSDLHYMFERMQQLDSWTTSVIAQTDVLSAPPAEPDFGDRRETTTARSIRAISRIKLSSAQIKTHRFRAFSDIPIFIKRHCDLSAANSANIPTEVPVKRASRVLGNQSISCTCSNLDQFQRAPSSEYPTPSDSSTSSDIHPYVPTWPQYPFASGFPYSPQQSAKICLRSALTISRLFEALPYPQPLSENGTARILATGQPLPRTMPSFSCCLMQSSYAMLMIFYKARVAKQLSSDSENELVRHATDPIVEELRLGLERIIAAISNYSLAFEALDGMRDEVHGAYQTAFSSTNV